MLKLCRIGCNLAIKVKIVTLLGLFVKFFYSILNPLHHCLVSIAATATLLAVAFTVTASFLALTFTATATHLAVAFTAKIVTTINYTAKLQPM